MQKIWDYLKNNSTFTIVLIATLVVCACIIVAICIVYKKNKNKKAKEKETINKTDSTIDEVKENGISDESKQSDESYNEFKEAIIAVSEKEKEKEQQSAVAAENKEADEVETKKEKTEKSQPQKAVKSEQKAKTTKDAEKTQEKDEEQDNEQNTRYAGKWEISQDENQRYFADLKASNGEIMLRSESYTSLSGIKSGIDTLKKNIEKDNFAISLDKNGNFVFKIFSTANRLLCIGEGYSTREQCEKAFSSVKRFSKTANIVVKKD